MMAWRLYCVLGSLFVWLHCLFVVFFCITATTPSRAETPPENVELLDMVAQRCIDSLTHGKEWNGVQGIVLSPHPAAERLQQHFALRLSLPVSLASATALPPPVAQLHVFIGDYSVRYHMYPNNTDSLVRETRLWLTATQTTTEGIQQPTAQYTAFERDTIARSDIPFVESRQYAYAQAPIPAAPPSLYDDVVEPLLIISSAIITTILLFTVRSQ